MSLRLFCVFWDGGYMLQLDFVGNRQWTLSLHGRTFKEVKYLKAVLFYKKSKKTPYFLLSVLSCFADDEA